LLRWAWLAAFLLFWLALWAEGRYLAQQRDDKAARERRPTWPRGDRMGPVLPPDEDDEPPELHEVPEDELDPEREEPAKEGDEV